MKTTLSRWLREAVLQGMALEEQNRPADMQAWRKLLCPPSVQTKKQPLQDYAVDKQVVQQIVESWRKSTSQSTSKTSFRPSSSPKRRSAVKQQHSAFPWVSLSLFLLGNVPTGACIWLLGNSSNVDIEAWTFFFGGLLSTTLVGAWSGAWVVAGGLVGAVAWSGTVAWAGAGAGAGALAGAGLLGAFVAGTNARDTDASWAGVGGSATTFAGFIAGLSITLLSSPAQTVMFFVLCLFQIVLLVSKLQLITKSLSALYPSKIQPYIILNAACLLGMLCGAGLAWWLSAMSNTAA